ncbi:MAG: thiamine pyrophosphate-dependent enzyme [Burkholderiaceae bacterium]
MTTLTGGQALAQQLQKEGLTEIFCIPGVQLDWAVEGLRELGDAVRLYIPRHEQTTSYMADGYARSSGRIGVCMTVPGPGLTNAMAGLSTAYACNAPLLSITGQIHSATIGAGYGMLHEIRDQSALVGSVTKWRGLARSPAQIPALVRQAVQTIRTGAPQPVGLEIPHDVLSSREAVQLIEPPADFDGRQAPSPASIAAAAALLGQARNPFIYAGGGVIAAEASAALTRLAETLQAPVVSAEMGRGAISDRHELALNSLAGRALIRHADVVLVVGSRFMSRMAPVPLWTGPGVKFIYVNADAQAASAPRRADVFVHADAQLALQALQAELSEQAGRRAPRAAMMRAARAWAEQQMAPIEPQYGYARALRRAIPEDGILVNELTQVGYFATLGYPVYGPRTLISPGYQGTLGYGFPTALGVAVANRGRTVVSINGDGGFGWGLQELATARRYGLDLITVVFHDGHFGNVRLLQQQTFGQTIGVELCNPDYQKLADAFGVAGALAHSPQELEEAIVRARERGGPALIEVRVGQMPSAWHLFRFQSPFKAPAPEPADPVASFL